MELINKFMNNAKRLGVNIDSIVVEQNGKVEECVVNNVELHELRSSGKVLIAMAYGIAINEHLKLKRGGVFKD